MLHPLALDRPTLGAGPSKLMHAISLLEGYSCGFVAVSPASAFSPMLGSCWMSAPQLMRGWSSPSAALPMRTRRSGSYAGIRDAYSERGRACGLAATGPAMRVRVGRLGMSLSQQLGSIESTSWPPVDRLPQCLATSQLRVVASGQVGRSSNEGHKEVRLGRPIAAEPGARVDRVHAFTSSQRRLESIARH